MGKFDGKNFRGLVGPLVLRTGKNGVTILQTRAHRRKQTKGSKVTAGIFGKASTFSKAIRKDLSVLINGFYDGAMINRLVTANRQILEHCYDKDSKKYTFQEDSFSRLVGEEFNKQSPLTKSLWVVPQVNLSGNQLTLSLPELTIGEHLLFPTGSNFCQIKVVLAFFNLEHGVHKEEVTQFLEISDAQPEVPAHNFVFEVPDGCLCVAGMRLEYYKLENNIKTVKNNKTFNPAAICAAIITPGEFVLTPGVVTPTSKLPSEWKTISKLKL